MRHHAKFHQNWPNGCRDMALTFFSNWRPSAILDFWARIGNAHDDYLVVSILALKLVGIDALVSIM